MQNQPRDHTLKRLVRSSRFRLFSSIRGKIVIPYLFLTIGVAIVGIYVVITVVAGSLNERLDTHLIESGRAMLDDLGRTDKEQLKTAISLASTDGVAEALMTHDEAALERLMAPLAELHDVGLLVVVTADGEPLLRMSRDGNRLVAADFDFDAMNVWLVRELLEAGDSTALPRRGIGPHPAGEHTYYYFQAIPISIEQDLIGVLLMGMPLETLLERLESASLAGIIIYSDDGQAIASTFKAGLSAEDRAAYLRELSITPEIYRQAIQMNIDSVQAEDVTRDGRGYRLVRGPLVVANRALAVVDVLLPLDFIYAANTLNRMTYVVIFTLATGAVILIGFLIARQITDPLNQLVETSKAIAKGDLEQRSGIQSADEVGTLARAFDTMTERLSERTVALQTSLQREQATASRMRSILLSIGDGVLFEDREGNFEPLNKAAESMLAEMSEHFLSGPMRELAVVDQEIVADEQVNPWLLESRRFQVANKVYAVHSAGVTTDDGENLGTVIVLRDVTAEVEAEQLKDAFIAHVSHELRTPLTAIKGYTALLLATADSRLDRTQYESLTRIGKQTDSLVSMINTLLDFSEVEASGRLGLRRVPLALSELAEEVYQEWLPRMAEKSLTFTLEMPDALPLVNADSERLRWALINLVRNAYQYTGPGGTVTLCLSSSSDHIVVDVSDTGAGISLGEQRNLFTRFYRVMQDQDDIVRGLGLGLYVTKAIIEAHNGYVQVVSEVGVGSTFSIVLPAMRETQLEPTAA